MAASKAAARGTKGFMTAPVRTDLLLAGKEAAG
jgi:hypothetical protein